MEVTSYDKQWWLRSILLHILDNIPWDLFGENEENVTRKAEISRIKALAVVLYSRLKKREPLITLGSY